MSTPNNKDKKPLEDVFRHRMQDAEATPTPDLWARIDHDLTVQENAQYKKRIVYYRQLAAACFVLFVMAGAVLLYEFRTHGNETEGIAMQKDSFAKTTETAQPASKQNPDPATQSSIASNTPLYTDLSVSEADKTINGDQTGAFRNNRNAGSTASKLENQATVPGNSTENRKADASFAKKLLAGSETKNDVSVIEDQPDQVATSSNNQSILLNNPANLNLLSKDYQKGGQIALDAANDTKKQAEALAQKLNADLRTDKKSDKGAADGRWNMSMAYMPTYFAQNIGLPDPLAAKTKRTGIASFGPAISAEGYANMERARDEYEENTAPDFSYAVDVKTGFKLGKKLKLLAGIGFSQNAARTKSSYVVEQHWSNNQLRRSEPVPASNIFLTSLSTGFTTDSVSVTQTDPFDVNYRYRMVSLPLGLQFENEIMNGWNWYMSGVVAANIMLESTVSSSRGEVGSVSYDDQDDSPFRSTQFSGNVGLGVSKQVSDAVSVALGPEFRGYFNTMLADPDNVMATQGKPYAIGLNMSLNYQLGSLKK